MEVKTTVFLTETDIRAILKKHLEKQGYKVIGELNFLIKRNNRSEIFEISAEVQKQFKNRISLPNENK
jgi:hypothetical protein